MTSNDQTMRSLGFHVSMLYIHHRMVLSFLQGKEQENFKAYSRSDFLGAQYHASEVLSGINALICSKNRFDKLSGNDARETTEFSIAMAQLAIIATGPATTESAECLMQRSLVVLLGKLAGEIGSEGFTMFSNASREWLYGALESVRNID